MQTSFDSACMKVDRKAIKKAELRLLEALRAAVAEISIKELAYRLDVSPSLLADSLAERSSKGVRAAWLVTIIDMASPPLAIEIVKALLYRKPLAVGKRRVMTPEKKNERYEDKFRSMGAIGLRILAEVEEEAAASLGEIDEEVEA